MSSEDKWHVMVEYVHVRCDDNSVLVSRSTTAYSLSVYPNLMPETRPIAKVNKDWQFGYMQWPGFRIPLKPRKANFA